MPASYSRAFKAFIYVEGWPDKSAGLSFDHDEMVLYFMKDGALKALTVESPVAADSAMEYPRRYRA